LRLKFVLLASAAMLASASAALAQSQPSSAEPAPTPASAPADKPAAETPPPEKPDADATTVEGVTVTSDPNAARVAIDRRSYSVAGDLQAQTGSVSDALRNVPGVQVDVQGNVSMRGSGVTILVDGKPSAMFSGDNQADALQNMPADQIERVEVITNPSAEFGPEGTGGMINLVTKHTRRQIRTVTVRGNVGTDDRYNGSVSGTLVDGPLTLTGNVGMRHNRFEFGSDSERSSFDPLAGQFLDSRQTTDAVNESTGYQARASAEYNLNPKAQLTGELRYTYADFGGVGVQAFEGEDTAGVIDNAFVRRSDSDGWWSTQGATLGYRHQYAGDQHDLSLRISYDHIQSDRGTEAVTDFTLPAPPTALFEHISNRGETDTTRFTADYQRPIGEDQRLKLGAEFAFNDNDYDFFGERGPTPGALVVDPGLTNRFLYGLNTQAVYFTYQRPIGPLTAQLGLRLQADQIDIRQVTTGVTAANNDTGVYPTLHLQYDLTDKQQLTASYSRRIQRPGAQDLNPYVIYIDPINLRAGNPDLDPAITNSYEAGWQYRDGPRMYLANLYLQDTTGQVTDVTRDIGGGVFLTTRENLADARNAGMELTATGKFTDKLTYQLYGDVHWSQIDGSALVAGGEREDWTYYANGTLNWQVTAKDFVQFSGWVWGGNLTPQGGSDASGGLNLGYRHKFNDDISFVFTANDLLDTAGRHDETIDTPLLHADTRNRFRAQAFYVGLTWTFGSGPRRPQQGFDFGDGQQGGPGGPGPG
jgi:outer membrane receptor protein involved in Fe transport